LKIVASNQFLKFKKKSSNKLQLEIDSQVNQIINKPEFGELKKGDLAGIRVYKFSYESQQFLLSYKYSTNELQLYTIGSHENFYKKLKGYLK
jgi:hypothetical protein